MKNNPIHSGLAFCANECSHSSIFCHHLYLKIQHLTQKRFAFKDASEIVDFNLTSGKESISGIADYCFIVCHLNSPDSP